MRKRSLLYRRVRFLLIILSIVLIVRKVNSFFESKTNLKEIPVKYIGEGYEKSSLDLFIKSKDGKLIVKEPNHILSLVNKDISLPENYEPNDLITPNVRFSFEEDIEKKLLRKEAAHQLEKLFLASEKEGLELYAVSGYRSFKRQESLFNNKKEKDGLAEASKLVAIPGHSEHQTGLAMDVSSRDVNLLLEESFEDTDEGKWIRDNSHKFGFIIRYPKEKEKITLYSYEPWHLRYVGIEAAKEIYENNLSLEEYLGYI